MNLRVILGTRGSELALTQTRLVEAALKANSPDIVVDTRIIRTEGDESAQRARSLDPMAGRKGLFTAEIERALLEGKIDIAVHSAKDLPSSLTAGTVIAATLPRGRVEDMIVSAGEHDLESLPRGGSVATGSIRRRYQLQASRPDLQLVNLSGNVPTRLQKLLREGWDAAVLARAGLERLGFMPNGAGFEFEGRRLFGSVLPADMFVPAGGQGIIAAQVRADDEVTKTLVASINHEETWICLQAEREFLRLLQADCNQPVGVFAILDEGRMKMRAQLFDPGKVEPRVARVEGSRDQPESLAAGLFEQINDH